MTSETCYSPGCSNQGAVWFRGLWCSRHAKAYGYVPSLAFRFAEIHRMNVAAETSGDRPAATTRTSGRIPSSFVRAGTHYSEGSRPRGRAVMATSSNRLLGSRFASVTGSDASPRSVLMVDAPVSLAPSTK